jgi:hypothetical protein
MAVPGALSAIGSVREVNQPANWDELAIMRLASSLCECQAKAAPIAMQNMINKPLRLCMAFVLHCSFDGAENAARQSSAALGRMDV